MMKNTSGVSLIVSTYNWPEALNLCLLSIKDQVLLPEEVIIADDGSGEETRLLIARFQKNFPVPLVHVWQEDEGFQLSRIRNKAIARASEAYIVQIDGDLILEKHFVKDHIAFREKGSFVSGTRVQMSQQLSICKLKDQNTHISLFSKGIKNFFNGVRLKPATLLFAKRYKTGDPAYVRGCNMAFWKADLESVNGYNEAITGWGREDSELAIRLINNGVIKRILKFGAVAYHIFHKEAVRENIATNDDILKTSILNRTTICNDGLSKYLLRPV
jgi:glycosyltransferase involved in cell wall biosynthesis